MIRINLGQDEYLCNKLQSAGVADRQVAPLCSGNSICGVKVHVCQQSSDCCSHAGPCCQMLGRRNSSAFGRAISDPRDCRE